MCRLALYERRIKREAKLAAASPTERVKMIFSIQPFNVSTNQLVRAWSSGLGGMHRRKHCLLAESLKREIPITFVLKCIEITPEKPRHGNDLQLLQKTLDRLR
jgi:hypothetical protein